LQLRIRHIKVTQRPLCAVEARSSVKGSIVNPIQSIFLTNNKQQTTNNKQQTTNNKQPTTNNKQQKTKNEKQPTKKTLNPLTNNHLKITSKKSLKNSL
jgi:hypothetical protein